MLLFSYCLLLSWDIIAFSSDSRLLMISPKYSSLSFVVALFENCCSARYVCDFTYFDHNHLRCLTVENAHTIFLLQEWEVQEQYWKNTGISVYLSVYSHSTTTVCSDSCWFSNITQELNPIVINGTYYQQSVPRVPGLHMLNACLTACPDIQKPTLLYSNLHLHNRLYIQAS